MAARPPLPVRPVRSWRLVAGGFLHFAVLGYFLLVPLACLLLAPPHASPETVARLALRASLLFLGGLAALAGVAVPAALLLDRRPPARGPEGSAEVRSAAHVAAAAGTALEEPLAACVARLAAMRWNHQDPRDQALARDLGEMVGAAAVALASAPADRRAAITERTAAALARIEGELARLAAARAEGDERQVELLSRYVDARYPERDFP